MQRPTVFSNLDELRNLKAEEFTNPEKSVA